MIHWIRKHSRLFMVVFIAALAGPLAIGCAQTRVAFIPLGSHTLRLSADQDTDVVWLVKAQGEGSEYRETVYRCYNSSQGPACAPAKVP